MDQRDGIAAESIPSQVQGRNINILVPQDHPYLESPIDKRSQITSGKSNPSEGIQFVSRSMSLPGEGAAQNQLYINGNFLVNLKMRL